MGVTSQMCPPQSSLWPQLLLSPPYAEYTRPPPGPQECYPVTVPAQSPYPHCLNQVQVRRRLFRDISSLSANLYNYQDKLFSLHTLNIQVSP